MSSYHDVSFIDNIKDSTTLVSNQRHLYSLVNLSTLPEVPADVKICSLNKNLCYILNSHFTNQDTNFVDYASKSRVFIYTANVQSKQIIDYLIDNDVSCSMAALKKQMEAALKSKLADAVFKRTIQAMVF